MKLGTDKKLKLTYGIIFILLFLTFIYSITSLKYSISRLKEIVAKNQLLQINLLRYTKSLGKEINFVKDILIVGANESFFNEKLKNYSKSATEVKKNGFALQNNIKNMKIPSSIRQKIDNSSSIASQIGKILEKTINIYKFKGRKKATDYLYSQGIDDMYLQIAQITKLNQKYYENNFNNVIKRKQNTILIIAIIFILAVIVALILINSVAQKFINNIKYLILSAEQVSLGMLDTPIESKTHDDLEDIAKVFEYLRIHIKMNIEKLKKTD